MFGNCLQINKFLNFSKEFSKPVVAVSQVLFVVLKVNIYSDFFKYLELLLFHHDFVEVFSAF